MGKWPTPAIVVWLDPAMEKVAALTELLVPCLGDWLEKTPASSLVNSMRNELQSLPA